MKEMYLKVEVEDVKDIDFVDVFFRKGRYFTCPKNDAGLVEIEDAEKKGAEKFHEAITVICFGDSADVKGAFDGYCTVSNIIGNFSLKEIIERVEKIKKMKQHVPETGDIYVSRKSGNKVAVLSYNEETRRVLFMGGSYVTNGSAEYFDKNFSFTGRGYADLESVVNELYSEEGDNT